MIFKLLFMNENSFLYLFLHSKLCMPEHLQIKHLTLISEVDCDIFSHILGGRFQDQQLSFSWVLRLQLKVSCHQVESGIFMTARMTICPRLLRRGVIYDFWPILNTNSTSFSLSKVSKFGQLILWSTYDNFMVKEHCQLSI